MQWHAFFQWQFALLYQELSLLPDLEIWKDLAICFPKQHVRILRDEKWLIFVISLFVNEAFYIYMDWK